MFNYINIRNKEKKIQTWNKIEIIAKSKYIFMWLFIYNYNRLMKKNCTN
jgi:hypothetical protein